MGGKTGLAALNWPQCSAVESVPGRMSGVWVLRGTRMPVSGVFENLGFRDDEWGAACNLV